MDSEDDSRGIQSWMNEEVKDLRKNSQKYLNSAISLGILPGKLVSNPELQREGEASAVYSLQTDKGKFAIKMRVDEEGLGGEVKALQTWANKGVKTPKIFNFREPDDKLPVPIAVMEWIEGATLSIKTPAEMIDGGVYRELGRTLAMMHQVKGEGFGPLAQTDRFKGKYLTFPEEMHHHLDKRIKKLVEAGLISNSDIGKINEAVEILEADIKFGRVQTLNHNDFGIGHIFDTKPYTVIDPDPLISHPFIDVAWGAVVSHVGETNSQKIKGEFLLGYGENNIDEKVFAAGVILRGIRTAANKLRKNRSPEKVLELVREYETQI